MTSIHFQFPVNWLKACFVTLALLCLGITTSQAQTADAPTTKYVAASFVNVPTAISRLEASVISLKTALNGLTPHTSAYDQKIAHLEFYVLILDRLKSSRDTTNKAVADAVTFAAQVINTDRYVNAPPTALASLVDLLEI